ncbi:MAG: transposase [Alphaproteobacteria bacterium]
MSAICVGFSLKCFCLKKLEAFRKFGRSIVYLDASGFAHEMPRNHGYAEKGKRCLGTHTWGARGRTNAIGALLGHVLITVTLFSTTLNTAIFSAWVIQFFC